MEIKNEMKNGNQVVTISGENSSITIGGIGTNVSTSTFSYDGYGQKELVGVNVKEDTIEILYKRKSTLYYTNGSSYILGNVVHQSQPSDQAIKEIYGVKKGKLTLLNTVIGSVISSYVVPESLQFPE